MKAAPAGADDSTRHRPFGSSPLCIRLCHAQLYIFRQPLALRTYIHIYQQLRAGKFASKIILPAERQPGSVLPSQDLAQTLPQIRTLVLSRTLSGEPIFAVVNFSKFDRTDTHQYQ
jgi:hypothetical protein